MDYLPPLNDLEEDELLDVELERDGDELELDDLELLRSTELDELREGSLL